MSSTKRRCLICTKDIPKNSLITHIAEHLSYKRHKCLECSSQSALMEIMVDHQTTTNHRVQFDMKNWYLDRVCQLIYNDFEYAQKNGENSIREFGSVFGDKKRLTEMLRACELREEDDDIEVISTHEVQNTSIHSKMPIPVVRRSLPENNEQQPSTNSKMPSRSPMTTHIRCISVDSVQQQQDLQTNIHSNNATNSDKQQEECELIRPVGTLLNVQTAPADSSNEHTKGQTTEQILVELQRQITKGMERKMCKICHQMVDNDYKSQKEHIRERHLIGIDENKMRVKLEQCFKQEGHLLITNDLQCNICGRETKYRDTRYHHVSTMHTDYQWNCVYPSCDFMIRSKKHFNSHLNNWHKMNLNQLEGDAKDCYVMMNSDFEHKLTPLVRKCFPFDLTSPTSGEEEERKKTKKKNGLKNREDVLVDSLVSSFMPTVERPAINRSNSDSSRKKQNKELKDEFESSSDSDCTDSEHKSKSKTPKEVQRGKKVDKVGRTSSSAVKHQWTKNESFDNAKTQPTPRSSAGPGSENGSYYSSPKSYYQPRNTRMHERKNNYRNYHERRRNQEDCESPLKEPRHHETKKQKIEKKTENIVYFRR